MLWEVWARCCYTDPGQGILLMPSLWGSSPALVDSLRSSLFGTASIPSQMAWESKGSHSTLLLGSAQAPQLEAVGPLAHRRPGGSPTRPGVAKGWDCRDLLWSPPACVLCPQRAFPQAPLSLPTVPRVLLSMGSCPHLLLSFIFPSTPVSVGNPALSRVPGT